MKFKFAGRIRKMKKLISTLIVLASFLIASPTFAYTVKSGDTLTQIARDNHLRLAELSKLNPQIQNLDFIKVGQTVTTSIPEKQNLELIDNEQTITSYIPEIHTIHTINITKPEDKSLELVHIEQTVATSKPDTVPELKIEYSDDELDLLARLVRAEAENEPIEGKIAVACVVLNRVESPSFPDTIRNVIYARGQFQPVRNGAINKPADDESIKAVRAALSEKRQIAGKSLFFYNPSIATSHWLDSRATTVVIGHHVFKS